MTTRSKTFAATGNGDYLRVQPGQSVTYNLTGSFTATIILEATRNGGITFETVLSVTAAMSAALTYVHNKNENSPVNLRWRCSAYTSGSPASTVADVSDAVEGADIIDADGNTLMEVKDGTIETLVRTSQKKIITAGAKVGGTAGWAVDAANDKGSLAKCPASQTASTLVVKIPDLKVGDTITAFGISGQAESAGGALTVDAELLKQTAVAADNTETSIGSITQIAKTADYLIADEKASLEEVVAEGTQYYIVITATTAASTDIDLLGAHVTVTEN